MTVEQKEIKSRFIRLGTFRTGLLYLTFLISLTTNTRRVSSNLQHNCCVKRLIDSCSCLYVVTRFG